jgi:LysR family transcriptional regulator, regulator of gene expression of beta-lactamase
MIRPHLPLNNLRAFEASARHLSFTNASVELGVTPAALSHQVKALEDRLGFPLFRRLPRGLSLTDEGVAMLPVLSDSLDQIAVVLEKVSSKMRAEIVSIGVVGTFAVCWLFPRLAQFEQEHPDVDLRISTNNNRVDLAEEGLNFAIRFGDGAWHSTDSICLFSPPFTPVCSPRFAERIHEPGDLLKERLLRSYRVADWSVWFEKVGLELPVIKGPMFDSARLMVDVAAQGHGVALAPVTSFPDQIAQGRLVQLFDLGVELGAYYLTHLKSRSLTEGMKAFAAWLLRETRDLRE